MMDVSSAVQRRHTLDELRQGLINESSQVDMVMGHQMTSPMTISKRIAPTQRQWFRYARLQKTQPAIDPAPGQNALTELWGAALKKRRT
jgi:hypothetical protein